jgi:hypothetical protein
MTNRTYNEHENGEYAGAPPPPPVKSTSLLAVQYCQLGIIGLIETLTTLEALQLLTNMQPIGHFLEVKRFCCASPLLSGDDLYYSITSFTDQYYVV